MKQRGEFLFVRDGITERRKTLVVQARRRRNDTPSIGAGFTATKKIGNAVIRNRAKRRLRAAAAELLPSLGVPGFDVVFIVREATASCDWRRLLDDMESALLSVAAAP